MSTSLATGCNIAQPSLSLSSSVSPLTTAPTLTALSPELRLEIYGHYFTAILAEELPRQLNPPAAPRSMISPPVESSSLLGTLLDLPLLRTSHLLRAEATSLHQRAFLPAAMDALRKEKARVADMLAAGRCFEWSAESARFRFGEGFGGAVVWAVYVALRKKVDVLEQVEEEVWRVVKMGR